MITIVDYGLGNVLAFVNVYKRLGIPVRVAKSEAELVRASKIILPGVGAFDHAIALLNESGMRAALEDLVLSRKVPVLGVCVGMQMLGRSSEEGRAPGLGWVQGSVHQFDPSWLPHETRLPHMGWNDVSPVSGDGLFFGLEARARFYFLHSYYFRCEEAGDVLAETDYGARFCCALQHGHIFGVQFHPEKSHRFGVRLLQNYAERT
jgi:glutamine amidotransferase